MPTVQQRHSSECIGGRTELWLRFVRSFCNIPNPNPQLQCANQYLSATLFVAVSPMNTLFSTSSSRLCPFHALYRDLPKRLVPTLVPLLPVAEQIVDNHTDDREDEDQQRPEQFMERWTLGFEEFDYLSHTRPVSVCCVVWESGRPYSKRGYPTLRR